MNAEALALLICQSLEQAPVVEIDGLGVFARDENGRVCFRGTRRPRLFIAYAAEDRAEVDRLYRALENRGYNPWLDHEKLLPGQNWPRRIEEAIENADLFLACFSRNSVNKRGGFQAEVRYALDCADRVPLDDIFLIPLRLDDCRLPVRITRETECVDLFPDWNAGFERVVQTIEKQRRRLE